MKGRPLFGAVCGLLFGGSLTLFLLTTGAVPLDSVVVLVLPVVFLVIGMAFGAIAPFKRSRLEAGSPAGP